MKNHEKSILKKLDRVMANCAFFEDFGSRYANLLPYVTSNHCPALLVMNGVTARKK